MKEINEKLRTSYLKLSIRKRIILVILLVMVFLLTSLLGYKYFQKFKPKLAGHYQNISLNWEFYKTKLTSLVPQGDFRFVKGSQSFFSILDSVGLHHKNGLYEIYGASIRHRQAGPLSVSYTEFHLTHDDALLFWQPDYSPSALSTHLLVQFEGKVPDQGGFDVFLQMRSGAKYIFKRQFGSPAKEVQPKPLPALIPDELVNLSSKANEIKLRKSGGSQFVAELPKALQDELSLTSGNQSIVGFGLIFNKIGKQVIRLKQVSLVIDDISPVSNLVSIGGSVEGTSVKPGEEISLVLENGVTRRQQISTDARFKFDDVPHNAIYSLRFRHNGRNYYGALGRWATATFDRDDINVSVKPLFKNLEGKAPDTSKARFITPREPSVVGAIYESHARQVWPGGSTPQEYDSITFTNNFGFIDRDRFFDNPDKCVRFVHLGSSHAVALQVRPSEKYNIELESELALRLQKCVEVISAGRDNGDIGSNYPRIRDYATRFKPEAILLESSNSLTMQLHPKLLRLGFGWDHEQSALDHFSYDQGKLVFRDWSPEYALHATKPDFTPLQPGIPLMRTLQVPYEDMHPFGIEAFKYLADIVKFLRINHPDQRFILHTGLDQAQCLGRCMSKFAGKTTKEVGSKTFVSNHRKMCDQNNISCIDPIYPADHESKETQLTFLFDGHYRIQGHQWLAKELADGFIGLNSLQSGKKAVGLPSDERIVDTTSFESLNRQNIFNNSVDRTLGKKEWRQAKIRQLPFPFTHLVTFASDVDLQTPENGAAIHRLMNERLGLPIADSIWVQGGSAKATSLFSRGLQLNRSPVDGGQHAVFGHIIREWHKGNADSFHSWQDDSVPQLSQEFNPAIKLSHRLTEIKILKTPPNLVPLNYSNLRVHFSGSCPSDLTMVLHDDNGRRHVVSSDQVRLGQAVTAASSQNSCMTDLLFGEPNSLGLDCNRSCLDITLLNRIDLIAPSCEKGCKSSLVRVTRDNFSRLTVKSQMPQVQAFNLRPTFLTSHGGWTFTQNFGWDDDFLVNPRSKGSNFENTLVQNISRPEAARKFSYAYHADLLKEVGITTIWSYFISKKNNGRRLMRVDWPSNLDQPSSAHLNFYNLQRTNVSEDIAKDSLNNFLASMKQYAPNVPADFLKDVYCTKECNMDQGSMLGLLLELSLSQARLGGRVENIWYTHFGSGNPDFKRTESEPLPKTAISRLYLLADHYYGWTKEGKSQRIWVPPAGVAINYRNMFSQISKQVTVRADTSEVHIAPWLDPVTGKYIGSGSNALQQLQGLTVYVPDSKAARVIINGVETTFFTRNGPDQTGQQSITLIDNTAPQSLIDTVPLQKSGALIALKGNVEDLRVGESIATNFVRAYNLNGEAQAEWRPRHLILSNISHISFEYRKQSTQESYFFLEIEMDNGGKIVIQERGIKSQFPSASRWEVPLSSSSDKWTSVMVPVSQLLWPVNNEILPAPLPLGQIKAIRFGIVGASNSTSADIRGLVGLRPSSNAHSNDGTKLIGGQVIGFDGKPKSGQVIRLQYIDGGVKETVTDSNGYYFYYNQPVGKIASITAGKLRCPTFRASKFIIRQDDPQWDVDYRQCDGD